MSRRNRNFYRLKTVAGYPLTQRSSAGMILPFIGICVILLMGTGGIASDLMRDFQAVSELKFAAQQTALYAASLSAAPGGAYSQSNIQAAITAPTTSLVNNAQTGPNQQSTSWSGPVLFADSDIQFVSNPLDNTEMFLQLTARRQGPTALGQFFLPLLYSGLNSALPQSVKTFATTQTVEVLGQPATRIGAGPAAGQLTSPRSQDLFGCAALPLAISQQQFSAIAAANQGASSVPAIVDLVSSTAPTAQVGHIPAAFINLNTISGGTNYYSTAQGNLAVTQLQGLLAYFSNAANAIAPGNIECGFQVSAFDPADPNFTNSKTLAQTIALINSLPARTYVLPVVAGNQPALATTKNANVTNTVVGFAYVQMPKPNLTNPPYSLNVSFIPSPPLRNASSAAGLASWPLGTTNYMPAPAVPFLPRAYDQASGGVSPRYPGVALAPALSPRLTY